MNRTSAGGGPSGREFLGNRPHFLSGCFYSCSCRVFRNMQERARVAEGAKMLPDATFRPPAPPSLLILALLVMAGGWPGSSSASAQDATLDFTLSIHPQQLRCGLPRRAECVRMLHDMTAVVDLPLCMRCCVSLLCVSPNSLTAVLCTAQDPDLPGVCTECCMALS